MLKAETRTEFLARWCNGRQSPEQWAERGYIPVYVSQCSEYAFPHWEMSAPYWDDEDKRYVIEPPEELM